MEFIYPILFFCFNFELRIVKLIKGVKPLITHRLIHHRILPDRYLSSITVEEKLILIDSRLSRIENLLLHVLKSENSNQERKPVTSDAPMGVDELSEFLDCSKISIYTKVSKREIPHIKKGQKLYFDKPQIIKWLQEGTRKTVDQIKADISI